MIVTSLTVKDSAAVRDVFLYWSPGETLAWPSRYWTEIKATCEDGRWQAEIPKCMPSWPSASS